MKKSIFKKAITLVMGFALILSVSLSSVSAAPLKRDPVKGYATTLPGKGGAGVLTFQDFESDVKDGEGRIGKFSATVPDNTDIPPAKIEIVSGVSKSGSKSLKVSNRGKSPTGEPQGYNTVTYSNIGIDIGTAFTKDAANKNKTENYFISAWVKNVDPSVTQYFWLQLQYGGSGEVWLPGQTYYEVKGSEWKQVGIVVSGDSAYYAPFVEDSTKSGIYAPRDGISTWSALKFITKNPKADPTDKNEKVIQTNYDFYVDDIVIWKVDDTSKLLEKLPDNSQTTPAPTTATTGGNATSTEPIETESTTDDTTTTLDDSQTTSSTSKSAASTTKAGDKGGLSAGAVVGIVLGVVAILGGGGFCLYWFVLRKKDGM